MQKAKWLSDQALQIAEKRREAKGKREKERYTHLDAEFQRITRRDKKAFFSNHAKMGTIKDRNGIDLTEAEDIKKKWQVYTKEIYKKQGPIVQHRELYSVLCNNLQLKSI